MKASCLSHKGNVRSHNEDSVYVNAEKYPAVAIVADGMGGHAAGKTASKMTVNYVKRFLQGKDCAKYDEQQFKKIVSDASSKILEASEKEASLKGMGTTLVMAVVTEHSAKIVNVGDSRAYILSKGELKLITKDHSYVQLLVDNGLLSKEEAEVHPYKNVITRAVGTQGVEADVYDVAFGSGDTLLLCSDGLTAHLSEDDITGILSSKTSVEKKTSQLVKLAVERGGSDNVTVAVIHNDEIIGKTLQNRYLILEEVAEGGMSHVYAAKCKRTGRKVAVKIFKEEMTDNPEALDGFKREAYICSKLHHKNIVKTLDVGKHDKLRYIVMEYIDGEDLNDLMASGCWDMKKSVEAVIKMLEALGYAHQKGVVHKDLKPRNVIMQGGEPVIIDFGIAEDTNTGEGRKDLILGTIDYFAPEQAMGEKVDSRSDIYSMGIMLYEMLTGSVPFSGADNVTVALKHLHQPAEEPRTLNEDIPESLNKIVMKAISKKKEDRYQNAAAMVQDLRRAFAEPDGAYIETEQEKREKEKLKQKKTIKSILIGSAAAVLVLIISIIAMLAFITAKGSEPSEMAYMPYLVDRDIAVAKDVLENMGMQLDVKVTYEIMLDESEDKVVSQSPSEGTVLSKGDTVNITVSSFTLKGGTMPDVMNVNKQWALRLIREAKIEDPTVLYKHTDIEEDKGKVFAQFPDAGETVTGSVVIYVYE